jgi:hypothetical protein
LGPFRCDVPLSLSLSLVFLIFAQPFL